MAATLANGAPAPGAPRPASVSEVRISFVSDVHGNADGLAAAARDAEMLVVLGDLLDFVDYRDPTAGILGEVFGPEPVLEFTRLRSIGDFAGLHRLNTAMWDSLADPVGTLDDVVDRRYRQMLDALSLASTRPLVILGNVDVQDRWEHAAAGTLPDLDGTVVEVGGLRLGFVAGGASRNVRAPIAGRDGRAWRPYVRPADEFAAGVAGLGHIDVLCTHLPPELTPLRYDTVPGRLEMFGPGMLEAIDTRPPRLSLFGHVHQPLAMRMRRGRTECVNVGHFARWSRPFDLQV